MTAHPFDALRQRVSGDGLFWGRASIGETCTLAPIESAAMARATPQRLTEFSAGRLAARRAMKAAWLPPVPVPMGADRAPVWPERISGSISHAGGLAVCVISCDDRHRMVGVDLERDAPLAADIGPEIVHAADVGDPAAVFSAKEAVFKALFPTTGVMFGFDGMRVDVAAGLARLVRTPETSALPTRILSADWPFRQARGDGMILSLCANPF